MELEILYALQEFRSDLLDSIMLFITRLGDSARLWIVTGVLLLGIPPIGKETKEHVKLRRIIGINMLLSLLLNFICGNLIMKNVVRRLRPFQVDTSVIPLIRPGGYSFPSGHTSSAFAAAYSVFLYHKKAGIAALIVAALIAFTRMYLFVHYPTDILGGMALGVFSACVVNRITASVIKKQLSDCEEKIL